MTWSQQAIYFMAAAVPLFILLIWSARRIRTAAEFYAAGPQYGGFRNGLAMTGDYLSAASFLGITGAILMSGYDGVLYAVGFFAGWPLILILLADKLRSVGRFTLADVLRERFSEPGVVVVATLGYFPVVVMYLAAQMAAIAWLLNYLFGLSFSFSLGMLSLTAMLTALTGQMIFSARVQIVKAVLILGLMLALIILACAHIPIGLVDVFVLELRTEPFTYDTTNRANSPLSLLSLGLALILGPIGLPHIMSRFFSVADEERARMSVFYATGFIGLFYVVIIVLGFLTLAVLADLQVLPGSPGQFVPELSVAKDTLASENLALIYMAHLVGGNVLSGVTAAVLAVVLFSVMTSLILTGSSAFSHDWYAHRKNSDQQIFSEKVLHRLAGALTVLSAACVASIFQYENVAYIVGLAFAFSASVNVPLLVGALYSEKLTGRAALWGGCAGLLACCLAVLTGPVVWVDWLGFTEAIFPWRHPALFTLTVTLSVMLLVSWREQKSQRQQDAEQSI